ncbi:GNAT family N-acetyltransferase [Pseudalkalibacillus sp. Hm43]|uniref:GNAT family N-acetyltransferase n=1 Tax=Pseudalkalibacillus sp. Hm43 TaxID=3450742 RepID=UPI003F42A483
MIINPVTMNELDDIADLFDQYRVFYGKASDFEAGKAFLRQRIKNEESIIYIAHDEEGRPMGFVQLYPIFTSVGLKRQWLLNDLFVAEKHRREGVAEALMAKAKILAEHTDASGILLETADDNVQAQALYEKLGYQKDTDHFYYFLPVE